MNQVLDPYEDRSYQEIGTKFLKAIRRGFLTDDFGLGKTPQAIKAAELPVMVVAPKYLIGQWKEAIQREHGDAVIALADGTRQQRDKILSKRADWYLVNLEMVLSYDMPTGINTYINDESHHLRNRRADQSKAVYLMENDAPTSRIYNLTATPFWKSVDDIWMQAHILYPQIFNSYHEFVKLYCMSRRGHGGPKVLDIKSTRRKDLRELMSPIMLGRTYADVGRYLPETIDTVFKLNMPPQQRMIYNKLRTDFSMKWFEDEEERKKMIFQPTTVLHALRQVTFYSGKIDAVLGILEDNYDRVKERDQPAVIGLWYKDHAKLMYNAIGPERAVLITGDLGAIERQALAMKAQREGKHIVATQASLAEGVNLYHYRLFIVVEEHYVPGSNEQFKHRVVRDRNDRGIDRTPVRMFYVQVRNSLDGVIHRVSQGRKKINEAVRELLQSVFERAA